MTDGTARGRKKVFLVIGDPSGTTEPVALKDSGAIHAIADPLRVKILRLLAKPASAKELADVVERPVTSLYHHLDLLEQHGLIEVADIRREGRTVVRRYMRAADRFQPVAELAGLDDVITRLDPGIAKRNVRLTRRIALAVTSALDDAHRSDKRLRMLVRAPIDPERLDELRTRLEETLAEFFDRRRGTTFEIVVTVAPGKREEHR